MKNISLYNSLNTIKKELSNIELSRGRKIDYIYLIH